MESDSRKRYSTQPRLNVALFVTCLADLFRPSVAFDTMQLLESAGCDVTVPMNQTCCGQPAYNSGDFKAALPVAKALIECFEEADYVVVPSGSCATMISIHYPRLFQGEWQHRAQALAAKTFELCTFLTEISGLPEASAASTAPGSVTYLDSCSGLRELGIREQPRKLLRELCDIDVVELEQSEVCCGFGGTFCTKMPDLAGKMAGDKLADASATQATTITGGDLGCLLHIAGRAKRLGSDIEVRHIAELLSGNTARPAIAEGES